MITIALLTLAGSALAGNLDPIGVPASTMVTLEEVNTAVVAAQDSRIPISSLPRIISNPGSYVVVQNLILSATDTHGITINASNVTVDLNGHMLAGPGKAAGVTGNGIHATTGNDNIAVFNGMIHDFRGDGIRLSGENSRVWQITAHSNGADGFDIGLNSTVFDNTASLNGGYGIVVFNGAVVRNNSCSENSLDGIWANNGSTVTGNSCFINSDNGIEANNSLVSNNACYGNSGGNLTNTGLSVDNYAP